MNDSPYPLMDAYLANLPRGLASYPDCTAKASLVRHVARRLEDRPIPSDVAPALRALLSSPPPPTSWISEVSYNAASLLVADLRGEDAKGFGELWYQAMRELVRSPLYRVILSLVTPERVLSTAADRWALFHRGTLFAATSTESGLALRLQFPVGLFDETLIAGYTQVFQALVDSSRHPGAKVTGRRVDSMLATWDLSGFVR